MTIIRYVCEQKYRVEFGRDKDGDLYWKIGDAKRGVILEQGTPKDEFEMLFQIVDTLETFDILGLPLT